MAYLGVAVNDDNEYIPRDLESHQAGDVIEELIASLDRRRLRNKRIGLRFFGVGFLISMLLVWLITGILPWQVAAVDVTICVICWVLSFILWKEH